MVTDPAFLLNAAMLRWLDEMSGQGVFATDQDLIVRSWNRWLERHSGLASASAVGTPLFDLYPDLVIRGLDAQYRAALNGEVSVLSNRFHGHLLPLGEAAGGGSGRAMPQSARIAPLVEAGAIVGTITVIEDVSERVASESELRKQIAASNEALTRAEEASRVKDEFLATLSHEIRTPLNAVLGWTKILRGRTVDAATLDHALQVIDRNAAAQALLIEDMLDMSRIVSGKLRLEMGTVDPVAATLAAIDVVSPAAAAKGLTLRTALSAGVPSMRGDSDRVQQIIWNILANAVKFTPSGGLIHIRLEQENGSVVFSVQDSGEGIDPDFLPFIFDRFRQAKASVSRTHGGLGLGLALVRQLVEMQGGQVSASSPGPGLGSTFRVVFPALAVPYRRSSDATLDPIDAQRLHETRVLVVDDERDARDLMAASLGQFGAAVSAVASVSQALTLLEAPEPVRPQILIADIGMPGEDGYELIGRVRSLAGEASRIPALAVTAYASDDDRRRALASGFDHHLAKPVTPVALVNAVAKLLGTSRK